MAALTYLTVQDVLWLNTQITGAPQDFDYARLEDGVFFQYGYGNSLDVPTQAERLLVGLAKKQPFAAGNRATALASTLVFLTLNGFAVAGDVGLHAESVWSGGSWTETDAFHGDHRLTTSEASEAVLEAHHDAIWKIAEAEAATRIPLEPTR